MSLLPKFYSETVFVQQQSHPVKRVLPCAHVESLERGQEGRSMFLQNELRHVIEALPISRW